MMSCTIAGETPAFFIRLVAVCRSVKRKLVKHPSTATPFTTRRVRACFDKTGVSQDRVKLIAECADSFRCERFRKQRLLRIVADRHLQKECLQRCSDRNLNASFCLARNEREFCAREINVLPSQTCDVAESLTRVKTEQDQATPFAVRGAQKPLDLRQRERASLRVFFSRFHWANAERHVRAHETV